MFGAVGFRWIEERGQGSADGVPRRFRVTCRGTLSFVDASVCVSNPEGVHRTPIAGNVTMLPHAKGLSNLERKIARECVHLGGKLPGTQALRRLMGHRQFGARIEYGDCLFLTVSPNEQHSALVLRLSRYRRNDPAVRHGEDWKRRIAGSEYPLLEPDVEVELPEYDLRRAATAQDPYAVIEAYKIEIKFRLMILLGVRMCPNCPRCNFRGKG